MLILLLAASCLIMITLFSYFWMFCFNSLASLPEYLLRACLAGGVRWASPARVWWLYRCQLWVRSHYCHWICKQCKAAPANGYHSKFCANSWPPIMLLIIISTGNYTGCMSHDEPSQPIQYGTYITVTVWPKSPKISSTRLTLAEVPFNRLLWYHMPVMRNLWYLIS